MPQNLKSNMMKFLFLFLVLAQANINYLTAQWEKVYKEKEGLRLVLKNGKYGFINSSDKVAIAPQFDDAFDFKNGYAVVTNKGKTGFIDKSGKIVIKLIYDKAYGFESSGLAKVIINKKEGKINKNGEIIIPIEYDKIYQYKQGLALVKKDNKYGYINTKGKIEIPIIYDDAFDFDKNYRAKVKKDGKTGKINLAGQVTWNIQIGDIINNGIVFYVDKSGQHGLICSRKDLGRLDKVRAGLAARKHEGYKSWRLPTIKELKLLLKQKEAIKITNKGYDVLRGIYWSSTEAPRGEYYTLSSAEDDSGAVKPNEQLNVRAVKEF